MTKKEKKLSLFLEHVIVYLKTQGEQIKTIK